MLNSIQSLEREKRQLIELRQIAEALRAKAANVIAARNLSNVSSIIHAIEEQIKALVIPSLDFNGNFDDSVLARISMKDSMSQLIECAKQISRSGFNYSVSSISEKRFQVFLEADPLNQIIKLLSLQSGTVPTMRSKVDTIYEPSQEVVVLTLLADFANAVLLNLAKIIIGDMNIAINAIDLDIRRITLRIHKVRNDSATQQLFEIISSRFRHRKNSL